MAGENVCQSGQYVVPCARELAALQAPLGVYAIAGKHDYCPDISLVTEQTRDAGLVLLRNPSQWLRLGDARLWLAGVDDV